MEKEYDNISRRDKFQAEMRKGVNAPLVDPRRDGQNITPIHTRMNTKGYSASERLELSRERNELLKTLTSKERKEEEEKFEHDMATGVGHKEAHLRSIRRIRRVNARKIQNSKSQKRGQYGSVLMTADDYTSSRLNRDNSSRYTASKRKVKRPTSKQQNLKGKVAAIAAAVAIAIGGASVGRGVYSSYSSASEPITLEQAEQTGKTAEDLKIDQQTLQEIQSLQETLNKDDISNEELRDAGSRLYDLQRDIIKSKLADKLGVEQDQIFLHSDLDRDTGSKEYIEINDKAGQKSNRIIREDQMPSEIDHYIQSIARTEANVRVVENGKYDSKDTVEAYKEVLNEASKFAAGNLDVEFETDENGNIVNNENGKAEIKNLTFSQTRQIDLKTIEQENEQDEER